MPGPIITRPLCIFHGNCADGFTAAWIVRNYFKGEVDFHAGIYQDPPPDVTDRTVVIVDFSYKRAVLNEMARKANSVLILDHHKSAAEDLADLQAPFGGAGWDRYLGDLYQDLCEGVSGRPYALFDMERSGAQITWDFFYDNGRMRPLLVEYTGDRDLWRFKLPQSRAVNAYVFAHEYTFENWDSLERATRSLIQDIPRVAEMGEAIELKHHKDVAELVEVTRRRVMIGGHEVPAANLPYTMTSDAGELMAQGQKFAACFWITPDGVTFSLRSREGGLDVSTIAALYGGGGHRNAAGFRIPMDRLGEILSL